MHRQNRARVLFIVAAPFWPWSGVALRARHTALTLAALGYHVDLLAVPGGAVPELPGVRVVRLPRIPLCPPTHAANGATRTPYRQLLLPWAVALAGRNRYAFVHGVDDAWAAAWAAARRCGATLIHEISEIGDAARLTRGQCWALRRAAMTISADPELVEYQRRWRRESCACLIANIPGTWQEEYDRNLLRSQTRARLELNDDTVVLAYVGSFGKYQGIDLLFNALPLLRQRPPATHLLLIGGGAAEITAARAVLRHAALDDGVTFLGRVSSGELTAIMAAADILVAPRRSGSHPPLKVLDYMLAGRAIVATDCVANRVALTNDCAVLAAPDPTAFAAALEALIQQPQRRNQLGAAARERVLSNFSQEQFQEDLRRCYMYARLREKQRNQDD